MENCKKYGANVIIHGENIGESRTHALKIAAKRGFMYVNGYDHPNILAGQGTMGLEILDQVRGVLKDTLPTNPCHCQVPDVDAIVIPVGGGGLIAGVALAVKTMKPDVLIIGVEPEVTSRHQGHS